MTVNSEAQKGAGKAGIGCLGLLCAMVGYLATVSLADMFWASTGRPPLDRTGGLGMLLAMGPPAWIAFGIAAVLAAQGKRFSWIAGSGVIVALASLALAFLALG